jgi:hypothetical protein
LFIRSLPKVYANDAICCHQGKSNKNGWMQIRIFYSQIGCIELYFLSNIDKGFSQTKKKKKKILDFFYLTQYYKYMRYQKYREMYWTNVFERLWKYFEVSRRLIYFKGPLEGTLNPKRANCVRQCPYGGILLITWFTLFFWKSPEVPRSLAFH